MKINLLLILLALCMFKFAASAQNTHTIKGITIDTAKSSSVSSTVTVLRADSVLQAFTYAGNNGAFTIGGLPSGKYHLLITFPEYTDYVRDFTLTDNEPVHDFGNVNMTSLAKILQEVIIKGSVAPVKIKGDTTEFNAKAFVVQPNAKVDDLLKQMPGMQVDENGNIKYQGEAIKKVLVDGEEFFGDDPVLVSKTLRADMIDKVQVFDKKSDQAVFTGIDDGQRTKTINLKLREDKKVGIFGKADLAGGYGNGRQYYSGQGIFNKFKANSRFSAYGTVANTGKVGLNYSDNTKIGASGSSGAYYDELAGMTVGNSSYDELDNANYNGRGFPTARTGGAHYDTKWLEGKRSINTNYRIGMLTNDTRQNTLTQTLYDDKTSTTSNEGQTSHNYGFRQKADVMYKTPELTLIVDGSLKNNDANSVSKSELVDQDGKFVNSSLRTSNSSGESKAFNASLLYAKKLKKDRRTFSWNVFESYTESMVKQFVKSNIDYANKPSDVVDQYKPNNTVSQVLTSTITYTEPLTKSLSLSVNYGLGLNNSKSDLESFNKSASGEYNDPDAVATNNYKYNVLSNMVGTYISNNTPKTTLQLGARSAAVNFKQVDVGRSLATNRNYVNWMPQASFQYKITGSKNLYINYNGSTQQPTVNQIQPVVNNVNPLFLTVGNKDLKQYFTHRMRASFSSSSFTSGNSFSISGNYSLTNNAIINQLFYDAANGGVTTSQYVNLNGRSPYSLGASISGSTKIKPIDVSVYLFLSASKSASYNYSQQGTTPGLNKSDQERYSAELNLNKNKAKKYSFFIYGGPTLTTTKNSFTSSNDYRSAGFYVYSGNTLYLPGNFQISSNINYNYTGASKNLEAFAVTMWNGSIVKTFLKGNNLAVSLTGNNLLNRDPNSRFANGNTITQSTYNVIKRYFMLTLTWDFTKFGTLPTQQ